MYWDQDEEPAGHYVAGHVTPVVFRASVKNWYGGKVIVPENAALEHVYVRNFRIEDDRYGNYCFEWRHVEKGRWCIPMTYWELVPNRNAG